MNIYHGDALRGGFSGIGEESCPFSKVNDEHARINRSIVRLFVCLFVECFYFSTHTHTHTDQFVVVAKSGMDNSRKG